MTYRSSLFPQFQFSEEEPVFAAPWEALAFAITVQLFERGLFTWSEWSEYLSKEIHAHPEDENVSYYVAWLDALVHLLTDKEVIESTEYSQLIAALKENT